MLIVIANTSAMFMEKRITALRLAKKLFVELASQSSIEIWCRRPHKQKYQYHNFLNLTTFLSKFTYLLILTRSNTSILFFLVDTKKLHFINLPLSFTIKTWSQLCQQYSDQKFYIYLIMFPALDVCQVILDQTRLFYQQTSFLSGLIYQSLI